MSPTHAHVSLHLHRATSRDNEVAAVDMKRDERKNSGQDQDQNQGQDPATSSPTRTDIYK